MRGIPKILATKVDYMNILQLYSIEECRPYFLDLLNDRYHFVIQGELQDGDDGITDSEHKVSVDETEEGIKRYQLERVENPNAKIFRIGFSVSEVESILQN